MHVDLKDIGPEGLSFDEAVKVPPLQGASGEPIEVLQARVSGKVLPGSRGLEFFGGIEVTLRLQCSRCLEAYIDGVHEKFHLTLVAMVPEPKERETEVTADTAALFGVDHDRLDLVEVVSEQIYLNLPLKPICRDDCRGLCAQCGANRNTTDCGCGSGNLDPRLAPLLRFKQHPRNS